MTIDDITMFEFGRTILKRYKYKIFNAYLYMS